MSAPSLLIRADASVAIGTGHVMRCLALAQAWQDAGGRAVFAMAETTPSLEAWLRSENIELVRLPVPVGSAQDFNETARVAAQHQAKWVVVDGYGFGSQYQGGLAGSGLRVLFLDDNAHCDFYSADLVLNQNVHADERMYRNRAPATRLLLGLQYALLRREYTRETQLQRPIPPAARNLLITMGGSDPLNFTLRVLRALPSVKVEGIMARVVIGGSSLHRASLEACASKIGGCVELLHDVRNMAELITWADVGVSAAGSVTWETCALGLPALLIPVAENQLSAATELARRGAARVLQPTCTTEQLAEGIRELMLSAAARETLSNRARSLLDTGGCQRVVAEILSSY